MRCHWTGGTCYVPASFYQSLIGPLVQTGLEAASRPVSLSAGRKWATQVDPLKLNRRVQWKWCTGEELLVDKQTIQNNSLPDNLTSLQCVKRLAAKYTEFSSGLSKGGDQSGGARRLSLPGNTGFDRLLAWPPLNLVISDRGLCSDSQTLWMLHMNTRLQSCPLKATSSTLSIWLWIFRGRRQNPKQGCKLLLHFS